MVPLSFPSHIVEGNMANLSPTIPTNISCFPRNIEYTELLKDFLNVFAWSDDGLPGIVPRLVECGIKDYLNVKPI